MWVLDFSYKRGKGPKTGNLLRRFILYSKELEIWYFFKICTFIYKKIIKILIKIFNIGLIDHFRNFCRTGSGNLAGSWQTFPPPHRVHGTVRSITISWVCAVRVVRTLTTRPQVWGVGGGGVHSDWLEKGLCENPCFTAEWWCNEK